MGILLQVLLHQTKCVDRSDASLRKEYNTTIQRFNKIIELTAKYWAVGCSVRLRAPCRRHPNVVPFVENFGSPFPLPVRQDLANQTACHVLHCNRA